MNALESVELRDAAPEDAAAIARLYVKTWQATYEGILPRAFLADLSATRLAASWGRTIRRGDDVVLVAVERGALTGFCSGGREVGGDAFLRGEVFTLYVAPGAQGRGVGGKLFAAMRARLAERRLTPVLVWVLAENAGARRFYERAGGVPTRRASEVVGGLHVDKIGYAFFDG